MDKHIVVVVGAWEVGGGGGVSIVFYKHISSLDFPFLMKKRLL